MNRTRQGALARLQRGTHSASGERLHWTYYDTAILNATQTDYSLFQVQLGAGTPPKTRADTNVIVGGQIPQGQKLRIKAIKIEYHCPVLKTAADVVLVNNFLLAANLRILIPGKDAIYDKGLTEVFGIDFLGIVQDAVTLSSEPLSIGRHLGIDMLSKHITLAALTPYEIRLSIPVALGATTVVGDRVRVGLAGSLVRAS